ncbi:MAG: cation:proton antiporter [Candidatus Nanohalobium sp.]
MVASGGLAFELAFIVVLAAVLGAVARRTGQPTVIAYIITGLILGPFFLDVISRSELTVLAGELGLSFLLFLIGLEIRLEDVRDIVNEIVLIGVVQMGLSAGLGFIVGHLIGFSLVESLFVAIAFAFSSTAVVVKLLTAKDQLPTLPGKIGVGVLLVQDLAAVILLALLSTGASGLSQVVKGFLEVGFMVAVIGGLSYLSSKKLLPELFKKVSENRKAFFIHGIAWAFIFIVLADYIGLSMEIGAFFAGLSLAQLPYSEELVEEIRPLTDFFMAVFFVNIGLGLTAGSLSAFLFEALAAAFVLIIGKFVILFGAVDRLEFTPETSFKSALNLSQMSEFSLILGSLGVQKGFIGPEVFGFISLTMITSVSASSYLINFSEQIYGYSKRFLDDLDSGEREEVEVNRLRDHAVIVGFDTIGERSAEILKDEFDTVIVVDHDSGKVKRLSNSPYEYIYGDFRHGEIRKASQIQKADFILSMVPDPDINKMILGEASEEATVFVKGGSLTECAELYELGAHYVIQENELAGEKISEYLRLYLEDRELFLEEARIDIERIKWGDRSV